MSPIFFPPLPRDAAARMLLNGSWRYAAGVGTADTPLPSASAVVQIPGEFVMQGVPFDPAAPAAVEREITIPVAWADMHIRLRVEAIYAECAVCIDGRLVAMHAGAFTPFDLDLTPVVQPGATHRLTLIIRHDSLVDQIAFGSGYADHPIAGVLRPLMLYALPVCHIRRLHAHAGAPGADGSATLTLEFDIANTTDHSCDDAHLELTLHHPDGRPIPSLFAPLVVPSLAAAAVWSETLIVQIPQALAWDTEHPQLYSLAVSLRAGAAQHHAACTVGCRDIRVADRRLLVNDRPVKLRGINRHDAHPLAGRAIPAGLARRDAELLKAANVNFIRTSHYPPPIELVEACDEIGLFLEIEAPICFAFGMFGKTPSWEGMTPAEQAAATELVVESVRRMIEYYRSHPAVLLWSIGNESTWVPPFEDASHAARAADPHRPQIFNWERYRELDAAWCEIGAEHYPAAGTLDTYAALARPILFDEYCHLPVYNRDELATDPGLHDLWGACLLSQWDAIYALPNGLGGSIWSGIDDLFLVPSATGVQVGGYGSWGPLDGWRRAKPELWHVQQVYAPVRLPQQLELRHTEMIELPIENRHDFTNLAELTINWQLGAHSGRCKIDLPPHTAGVLRIPEQLAGESELVVTIADRYGRVVLTQLVMLVRETPPPPLPAGNPCVPRETAEAYVFAVPGGTWRLDRQSGRLSAMDHNGRHVLLSGPTLALIPRDTAYLDPDHRPRRYAIDDLCSGWRCTNVARAEDDPHTLIVRGIYREADVVFQIGQDGDGLLVLRYHYTPHAPLIAWQIGLSFTLDAACDTLTWQRAGLWSRYPADHIGRLHGSAPAYHTTEPTQPTEPPAWPWALDQNQRGTNDFRSTKYTIRTAALTTASGSGLQLVSDGTQHVRAAMIGDTARFLCLDYADIGSEYFLRSFFTARHVVAGQAAGGVVRLRLLSGEG